MGGAAIGVRTALGDLMLTGFAKRGANRLFERGGLPRKIQIASKNYSGELNLAKWGYYSGPKIATTIRGNVWRK